MSVELWRQVLSQATQDADGFCGNEDVREARRWLELPEHRPHLEMVCSMAGISIERLDALVKSKPWYGENHGEPLDNKRECTVCQKSFVPRTNKWQALFDRVPKSSSQTQGQGPQAREESRRRRVPGRCGIILCAVA